MLRLREMTTPAEWFYHYGYYRGVYGRGPGYTNVEIGMMEVARWTTVALIQNRVWWCDELA